jgi:hypothetical protein
MVQTYALHVVGIRSLAALGSKTFALTKFTTPESLWTSIGAEFGIRNLTGSRLYNTQPVQDPSDTHDREVAGDSDLQGGHKVGDAIAILDLVSCVREFIADGCQNPNLLLTNNDTVLFDLPDFQSATVQSDTPQCSPVDTVFKAQCGRRPTQQWHREANDTIVDYCLR